MSVSLLAGDAICLSNLSFLLSSLFFSLLKLFVSLLLVVDFLEVELVKCVLFVLEVSKEGHAEDPYVCEDEDGNVQPHCLIWMCRPKGTMSPEDQGVHAVVTE